MRMRVANYEYFEKIGQGAFGMVYKGRNVITGELVVVKTEPYDTPISTLKHESAILNILYSKSCRNIPPTYWYGLTDDLQKRVFVMPYYDETVEMMVVENREPANYSIFRNIMRSAILILKSVHDKYVVHRDIKPANWMIRRNELVLIDFGLASFYVDADEKHVCAKQKLAIVGSPKYASWNIHCGEEYGRRDDLLSLVYIGLFCLEKRALWSDIPLQFETAVDVDNSSLIHPRNQWFKSKKCIECVLTQSASWSSLKTFAKQVYELSFQERPSYDEYANLFV